MKTAKEGFLQTVKIHRKSTNWILKIFPRIRPKRQSENRKKEPNTERISLRFDVELLSALEIAGSGWMSRVILKEHFQGLKRDTSLQAEKEPRGHKGDH